MFNFPNNDADNILIGDIDLYRGDPTYNIFRYIIKKNITIYTTYLDNIFFFDYKTATYHNNKIEA